VVLKKPDPDAAALGMALITLYCYATTTKLTTVVVVGTVCMCGPGDWRQSEWERGAGASWVEGLGLGWVCELGTGTGNGKGCRVGGDHCLGPEMGLELEQGCCVGDHLRFGLEVERELE
jgi:hypothetical protein